MSNHAPEPSRADAQWSQRKDRRKLTRHLLILVGILCLLSTGLHVTLWVTALIIEPFRPIYFGFHAFVGLLLALTRLVPAEPSLGFFIVGIPAAGGFVHTLLIGAGGLVGGRVSSHRNPLQMSRSVFYGGAVCLGGVVLLNGITACCLWYFGLNLTDL
jgi:hypothetical protein